MNAVENTVNYNERFITKAVREISDKFHFNVIQQKALSNLLYKCTQNVEMKLLNEEDGDFLTYIDIYANSMKLEGLSEETIKNKCYTLKALNRYLEKDINKISVADLKMYILHKQTTCKSNTLNTIITTIKSFFNFLYDEGYLDINPSRKLKKVKEEKRLRKSLNDVSLEQVRLASSNKRDRALIEFTYSTGLRVSELVKLNINDLDFTSNRFSVVGKGNKERNVMFSDIAKFYLKQYLNERKDNNTALFVGIKKPHNRMSTRAVEKIFEKMGMKL